jgi:hypothetical protein
MAMRTVYRLRRRSNSGTGRCLGALGPDERGDARDHINEAEQLGLLKAGEDDRVEPQE